MGTNRLTLVAALIGVAATGMIGCNKHPSDNATGTGAANIAIHSNLSIVDVSSVKLTVQSPTKLPTPLNVPLNLKNGQYTAQVNQLVTGSDYVFSASAMDSHSTTIFHGVANSVAITSGATTQVALYLDQVNPTGPSYAVPVIDSVSFSPSQVGQGGTASLSATAHSPTAGYTSTLAFAWVPAASCGTISLATATGGSDTADRTATATYTAPLANVDCQINLTVTDAVGGTNSAAFSIRVGLGSNGSGNALVTAQVNGAPIISSVTSTPAQITLNPTVTPPFPVLAVTATDPESDPLTYMWNSVTPGCTVQFGSPATQASATTTYVVTAVTAGTTSCAFTVTVQDTWGPTASPQHNTVVSSLTLPVGQATVLQPPLFGLAYQSDNTVTGGENEVLAAVATDPTGGTLTYAYSWAVDSTTGTSFTTATPAALGLDPIFTTAGTWTAPSAAQSASTATFTVTATSSVSHLSASYIFVFAPASNPCIGVANGTTCSIPSNLCIVNATCQGGACVGTQKACTATPPACQSYSCTAATGACNLANQPTGTACNDHNGCTTGDACAAGVCVTAPVSCPAPLVCQASDACVSTGDATYTCNVTNSATGTACAGSDPCFTGDTCSAGACVNGTALCTSPQVCQVTAGVASCTTPACMNPNYDEEIVPPLLSMANGADGTVWAAGDIYNPFTFGPGVNLTSTGSSDIYLVKLNPATGVASFGASFGQIATPNSTDQIAIGVATAKSGGVGLIGSFISEIDFDGNDSVGTNGNVGSAGLDFLTTAAASAYFVATFDSSGNPVHSLAVGLGTGTLLAVASNPNQDAFAVCGVSSVKATGGILTGNANVAGGGLDIVVAKINATTGLVTWGKQFGGAGDQLCQAISMDNSGNVIIAGGYNGTLQFGTLAAFPVVSQSTYSLLYTAVLASADGTPTAASTWGATGKVSPFSVAVDASNNIIVAGSLGASVSFGGTIGTVVDLGLTDAFVAKLSVTAPTLNPIWAKSFGDAAHDQQAKSVATSSNGDVYVGGLFSGTLGAMNLTSFTNTNSDGFVAHLSGVDGSVLCAHVYGDAAGVQETDYVTVARTATGSLLDNVVIGGAFTSTITFSPLTPLFTGTNPAGNPSLAASYITGMHN